eukprot:jgi/Chlat1/3865/Chrsp26S04157
MLVTDKVLREAVCPAEAMGVDKELTAMATVTEVDLSNDLQVAKVYISVFGDEREKTVAMAGLKAKEGYVRSGIGRRVRLRLTPEIRFIYDDSFARGTQVLSVLQQLRNERDRKARAVEALEAIEGGQVGDGSWDTEGLKKEKQMREEALRQRPEVAPGIVYVESSSRSRRSDDDDEDVDADASGERDEDDEGVIYVN